LSLASTSFLRQQLKREWPEQVRPWRLQFSTRP
jgi:hypothetical protein